MAVAEGSGITLLAHGKINLCLDITGVLADGYHSVETVMHSIGLCDTVTAALRPGGEIRVTCSHPGLPAGEANIAYKAARLFFARLGVPETGICIHIDKAIPFQAGLGGGSADAAAVLIGLDALLNTNAGDGVLREIGLEIGADVPFCLAGGCMLAEGKGERLRALPRLAGGFILIAKPLAGVSTAEAFRLYDEKGAALRPDMPRMLASIERGDLKAVGRSMGNVFEELTSVGETRALKRIMLDNGALGSVMTGSGSAVAGLFADRHAAESCRPLAEKIAAEVFVTNPCDCGVESVTAEGSE